MLDNAFKYEEQIKYKMLDTWYDEKYMFYHGSPYHEIFELSHNDGDWNSRQFVSLDVKGNLLGLIGYGIDRQNESVNGLGAINFSDNKLMFGKDIAQVVDDIFCKFNMRKINFSVFVGNPIEKSYDRLIHRYGGRIVGIKEAHCKLIDGNYYDRKEYELFKAEYLSAKLRLKQSRR